MIGIPELVDSAPLRASIEFLIQHGSHRIRCAVTADALDSVCGHAEPTTDSARRRAFERFRTLINVAAQRKLDGLGPSPGDTLLLTGEDLRSVPHVAGTPVFGTDGLRPK